MLELRFAHYREDYDALPPELRSRFIHLALPGLLHHLLDDLFAFRPGSGCGDYTIGTLDELRPFILALPPSNPYIPRNSPDTPSAPRSTPEEVSTFLSDLGL